MGVIRIHVMQADRHIVPRLPPNSYNIPCYAASYRSPKITIQVRGWVGHVHVHQIGSGGLSGPRIIQSIVALACHQHYGVLYSAAPSQMRYGTLVKVLYPGVAQVSSLASRGFFNGLHSQRPLYATLCDAACHGLVGTRSVINTSGIDLRDSERQDD